MRHIKGGNCMIASLAMIIDLTYEYVASQLPDPNELIGNTKRGIYIMEVQCFLMKRGYGICPIYIKGGIKNGGMFIDIDINPEPFLYGSKAMLFGNCPRTGCYHTFAWNGHHALDPKGIIYEYKNLTLNEVWLLSKLI